MLSKETGSIDIGNLCKINERLDIKQGNVGLFSPPAEYILYLPSFYLNADLVRENKFKLKMP